MRLLALSHLVLTGPRRIGGLARLLGISSTAASLLVKGMERDGLVVKERAGKAVVVRPNPESPFVRSFSAFAVAVGAFPPLSPPDLLEPASRRKIILELAAGERTVVGLAAGTGYSRMTVYDALRPLRTAGVVPAGKTPGLDRSHPLTERLLELAGMMETKDGPGKVLGRLAADRRVWALGVFGSAVSGQSDALSDIDAFVVVGSPGDTGISREYSHPRLHLSIYSRRGLAQLAVTEPWFLKLATGGRVLKGRELLSGLENLPARPDTGAVSEEIRTILARLSRMPAADRAKMLVYCIRTAVAMRLYFEGALDQERLDGELHTRYPEFGRYRRFAGGPGVRLPDTRPAQKKVLEELAIVEKRKEKRRQTA